MISQLVRKAKHFLSPSSSATNQRSDYYYNRIYFKRLLFFFRTYNEAPTDINLKPTREQINPLGLQFGSSTQLVTKELGEPKYVFDNKKTNHHHQVYFFRKRFTDLNLLVQVQFFNNQLFFIGLDVTRRLLDENEKSEIINTVIQKYLHQPHVLGQAYPLIQDSNKNLIIINDDINFSICYLGGGIDQPRQAAIAVAMEDVLKEKPDKGSLFYAF